MQNKRFTADPRFIWKGIKGTYTAHLMQPGDERMLCGATGIHFTYFSSECYLGSLGEKACKRCIQVWKEKHRKGGV